MPTRTKFDGEDTRISPVRRYHKERTRAQTDEGRGQRAKVCEMLSKWRSFAAGEVSSFTVSAVTGITFRFVLAHDESSDTRTRYHNSRSVAGREGSFVAVNTRLRQICDARTKAGERRSC